ncbi:MAG: HBL/NHE enterotoxin family protein [Candidatus Caenarcaniphilales bacterium]|nr:HBL/NHE enterotoxin family protein [Candidatus Caenarcaniphilales bacterium]
MALTLEKTSNANRTLGPGHDAGRTGSDAQSQAAGSGHVIRTYCETVKEQPTEGLPSIITTTAPDFVKHLVTAQGNASHYINDIQPVLLQNVSDLVSYSNMWNAFSPQMRKYAAAGDYKTVAQGLKVVQGRLKTFSLNAGNAHSVLIHFQNTITDDAKAFNADYKLLTSTKSGIPAQIDALDKEIDAENDAIGKFAGMIAGGAAAAALGGVMIVAGAVTDVITAGTSTPLIAAGVLVGAGGVALITVGAIGIDKASKAVRKATIEKASLNQELTSLKAYCSTVGSLKSGVTNSVTAVGNLASSWDYIYEDLNAVIYDLETASSSVQLPWFDSIMDEADSDWAQVGTMAKAVQLQTANSSWKKVNLDQNGSSLLDALPDSEKAAIRAEEARKQS